MAREPPPDGEGSPGEGDGRSSGDAVGGASGREVPSTDIEVEAHLHFGMTGAFPLRLGDLFFADDGLYIAEYSYITPFIGLTARKHRREARAMGAIYDRYGIDAVLVEADTVVWHAYGNLARVAVSEGGLIGRPKVAVYPEEGPSHAYRFHDRPAFEEAAVDVEESLRRRGVEFERDEGLGFSPGESLRRFFWRE